MYINYRKETFRMTDEILSITKSIKRLVITAPDTYFHWAVNFYLKKKTKQQFINSCFFDEFDEWLELKELLERLYLKSNFRVFKRTMVTLSNSIVIERIREETSLVILSELTDYISISFLRHLEREKPDNKYYKFSLLYKILEPIFCLPIPSYARTSQAKIVCKKITDNLSPKIVDFLDHPEDFGCFEVKSNWLITEIEKSLW